MSDSNQNVIYGINGPVVTIRGATTLRMIGNGLCRQRPPSW